MHQEKNLHLCFLQLEYWEGWTGWELQLCCLMVQALSLLYLVCLILLTFLFLSTDHIFNILILTLFYYQSRKYPFYNLFFSVLHLLYCFSGKRTVWKGKCSAEMLRTPINQALEVTKKKYKYKFSLQSCFLHPLPERCKCFCPRIWTGNYVQAEVFKN